jgi:hypothetical protein
MTVTVKNIIPPKQAENSQQMQYTALNCKAIIDKFTVTNTTGGAVTISVNLVVSGGSASAANRIISVKSVAAGECYTCPELIGHILESGGFISTLASAATSLTIDATGREIT